MREIKFRAWNGAENRMYSEVFLMPDGTIHDRKGRINDMYGSCPILMQYAGLKDKSGVEIYEGDVVRWYGSKHTNVIEWLDFEARFSFGDWYENDFPGKNERQVIGNIYQNPELPK